MFNVEQEIGVCAVHPVRLIGRLLWTLCRMYDARLKFGILIAECGTAEQMALPGQRA
jgi:hypothetical protein